MIVILTAFTLFHVVVGTASLGLAVRLLGAEERAHWRSQLARYVALALCWIYPALAFVCTSMSWRSVDAAMVLPLMLAPILWLIVMGLVFAIVDFAEDGVLGNARSRERP
jgi:hypothetical protein